MPDDHPEVISSTKNAEQQHASCANVPARKEAESASQGKSMARRRFQEGQLYKKGKNWVGRWSVDIVQGDGQVVRIRRARVIGSIRELPTKPLAKRKLQQVLAPVNDPAYRPGRIATLADFVERWQAEVLPHCKQSTINAANSHLRMHILPNLGSARRLLQLSAILQCRRDSGQEKASAETRGWGRLRFHS
jgi:hypothetical protein